MSLFNHTCGFCNQRSKQTYCYFDLDPHFMPRLFRCTDHRACMDRMLGTPEGYERLRGLGGLYFAGMEGLPASKYISREASS